jgi:hypothetical protein
MTPQMMVGGKGRNSGKRETPSVKAESDMSSMVETLRTGKDKRNMAVCVVCGSPKNVKSCSGCRQVRYCGAACQKDHWRQHKAECKKAAAAAKLAAAEK